MGAHAHRPHFLRTEIRDVRVDGQLFLAFTLRDGRIARIDDYLTRVEALEAAGMTEPPAWR